MNLKISYYLKTGEYNSIPVIALISFGYSEYDVKTKKKVYKPIRYYTPVKVLQSEWDSLAKLPRSKVVQNKLVVFEKTVEDCYKFLQLKGERITPDSFKAALDIKTGKTEVIDKLRIRMLDYIDDYMLNAPELKKETGKRYKNLKKKVTEFEKQIGKPLFASDVNEDIYLLYADFVRTKVERNNSLVSNLKDFMATLRKIAKTFKINVFNPTKELESKDQPKATIEDKVYLNFKDIQKVINYKPLTERMENIKLIFLTLLLTGCRYGDVFKIKLEKYYNMGTEKFHYCHFITNKLNKEVVIPILKPLHDAIIQNGGRTAKRIFLSDFDFMVKVLVKECGISHEHSLTYTDSKGMKKFTVKPFCEFVSSHTGRRSFITNLINYVPVTMLCKITTHELSDKSIIFIYNKISLIDNAVLFMRQLRRSRLDYENAFPFRLV